MLRGTTLLARAPKAPQTALAGCNGPIPPPAGRSCSPAKPAPPNLGAAGEFSPTGRQRPSTCSANTLPGSHLSLPARWRMAYYSCSGLRPRKQQRLATDHQSPVPGVLLCGPRGIRTLDLLNAIETRSQLRYGPNNTVTAILPVFG